MFRFLVTIQAVDLDDPLMGFFHEWLRRVAQQDVHITVLALRVGRYDLPNNIEVIPLRARDSRSRLVVMRTLIRESWKRRKNYQAVFVRGDAQYAALVGWFWRILNKKVVLWYAHYTVTSSWLKWGAFFSHHVVTSVSIASPIKYSIPLGQSIPTDFFVPSEKKLGEVLIFGRVSPVKRIPWIVEALPQAKLHIVGRALESGEREKLQKCLSELATWEDRDVSIDEARRLYQAADIVINATPGSLDKTILEAAACECIVLAASSAYRDELPDDLRWLHFSSADELRQAFSRAIALSMEERKMIGLRLRAWVEQHHSLVHQLDLLLPLLRAKTPKPRFRQRIKRLLGKKILWTQSMGVSVFMFHAFDGRGTSAYDPDRFSELVQMLRVRGFSFIRLFDVWKRDKSILITIDDATEDVLLLVPMLKSLQVPVLLFAPASLSQLKTSDGNVRRVLTQTELVRLEESGFIDIGGHGVTHKHLTECSDEELEKEITGSYRASGAFAYPRGRVDDRVAMAVSRHGFQYAFTVKPGLWTREIDPMFIPRYPIMNTINVHDIV